MRYGSLVWDEMAIAEDLTFDSKKLVFEGFVDYGEDDGLSESITLKSHEGELADHVLVFIFRPYRFSWIQPIACYATKGACPGGVIHQLLARAITVLEQNDAIVKNVVCDGAQSNKTVMKLCGVSGKYNSIGNAFNIQRKTEADINTPESKNKSSDALETANQNMPKPVVQNDLGNPSTNEENVSSFDHPTLEKELIFFSLTFHIS